MKLIFGIVRRGFIPLLMFKVLFRCMPACKIPVRIWSLMNPLLYRKTPDVILHLKLMVFLNPRKMGHIAKENNRCSDQL